MSTDRQRPPRLTEIISGIDTSQPLTVGTIVDSFGERAFGALMFVFAVPNMIPMPPGTSAVLGLPLVILTFQLMLGRQTLWLPEAVRRRPVSGLAIESFVNRAIPVMARFEKILRPRLSFLVLSNTAERAIGIVAFVLAAILFLPIPLVNMLPAASIAVLSLALAERDGVAAILGYLLAAATFGLMWLVSSAIYAGIMAFINALFGG